MKPHDQMKVDLLRFDQLLGHAMPLDPGASVRRAMRNFAERARLFLMRSASIGKIALRLRSSNVGAGASSNRAVP